jgi:hypothetical protein
MSNGGKITRWPVKYPRIKKNARPLLHTRLQASVNTHMYYYEITASKANKSIVHREYAAFVTQSDADQLRVSLESNYDVVGVVRITRKQYLARVSQI